MGTCWIRPRWPALALLALVAGLGLASAAWAYDTEECLECHGDPAIKDDGGAYLYIDPVQFDRTPHADVGCTECHSSVSEDHPDDGVRPGRAGCGQCHEDVQEDYAQSVHADNATCTDCHNPHRVEPADAMSGLDMNRVCTRCHEEREVIKSHGVWLVQPELHIASLPCVTCHTGSENYVITFYIAKTRKRRSVESLDLATPAELRAATGGTAPEKLLDEDGDGTVSLAELRRFVRWARRNGLDLWGMLTPETVSHRVAILDNRWDCTFCHASGPSAAQTSYVAVPDGRGGYHRIPVEKGAILDAVYGTPDFYMVGVTRNRTLDKIGLMIVGAGLLMPIGHGTLRLLTWKNRKKEG